MSDGELLELAARAAGMWPTDFELGDDDLPLWDEKRGFRLAWGAGWWNPRDDDADAFRLAVKLMIHIEWWPVSGDGAVAACTDLIKHSEPWRNDRAAATRRAIVRAAAAIGEGMG